MSIVIENSCGVLNSFVIGMWNCLEEIKIGNKCCKKCKSFKIMSCPRLKLIEIGMQSFINATFSIQSVFSIGINK